MLPPHSPPPVPLSRPDSRARSRSHSSASHRNDEGAINVGHSANQSIPSKSHSLPDIAINALRGLQAANDELAEEVRNSSLICPLSSSHIYALFQRRQTQSVLNQLNALSSAHDALKSSHGVLQQGLASTQQERDVAKRQLRDAQGSLAAAEDAREKRQKELNDVVEQLAGERMELKAEREGRKRKMAGVSEQLEELGTK